MWTIPFWTPRPVTWTMFIPWKPASARAFFTSSSFSGRMMASIFCMASFLPGWSGAFAGGAGAGCYFTAFRRLRHGYGGRPGDGRDGGPTGLVEDVGPFPVLGDVQAQALFVLADAQAQYLVEREQDGGGDGEGVNPDDPDSDQ